MATLARLFLASIIWVMVNLLFVDGSVRFLRETTSRDVLRRLKGCTKRGRTEGKGTGSEPARSLSPFPPPSRWG
jgi:prepilin-type processing-associated H-X9-DG protein